MSISTKVNIASQRIYGCDLVVPEEQSSIDIQQLRNMVHEGELLVDEQSSITREISECILTLSKKNLEDLERERRDEHTSVAFERGVLTSLNILVEYLESTEGGE